ncbi:MAG: radical SAM protein [Armatimonadota bacterium]
MPSASYLRLHESGELCRRAQQAISMLASCAVCPRECRVNRLEDETGFCRTGRLAVVSSYNPHFGEEAPLVGRHGSGTIFFTHCNLGCIYCQNYDISHLGRGRETDATRLADMMLGLQEIGCHNINFVTPTHVVPQLLEALDIAAARGLRVPLVYNCGGYESIEILRLLDGVFDIYMPDAKYADPDVAKRLSDAPDYPEVMRAAITEMHRQVGDLQVDERGVAVHGLLVRHLVLPNGLAGTRDIMRFLASLSENTYVNVMAQYRPCYRAHAVPEVNRGPTREEFREAVQMALDAGLTRLDERRMRLIFL